MCTIKSRRLREQTKIHIRSYTEIPITIFSHLHFLTSNPAILKAFPENFSTKMKPSGSKKSKSKTFTLTAASL